jgi:poly(A) polymerase
VQNSSQFLSKEIQELIQLKQGEKKLYLVGGVVRDYCLGRQNKDVDVLCDSDTRLLARKFADMNEGDFFVMDAERNTSRVILPSKGEKRIFDFARMRGSTLQEDLLERDFTINAMAIDVDAPDVIIDPMGGQQDLIDGIIRECSAKSFSSDPVRVIRAIRYGLTHHLTIEETTLLHLKQSASALDRVSGERKRDELIKILETDDPEIGFEQLYHLGILKQINLPEPLNYDEAYQRIAMTHELLVKIYKASGSDEVIPGVLPLQSRTRLKLVERLTRRNTSDRSEHQLLILASLLGRMNLDEIKKITLRLLLSHEECDKLVMLATSTKLDELIDAGQLPGDREMYHYFRQTGETGVDLALLALAASVGKQQEKSRMVIDISRNIIAFWFEKPEVANPVMLLNGNDLMVNFDLTPGRLIGELIEKLREEQAAGTIKDRETALSWVEAQLAKRPIQNSWD